jgi:hypothetical protein
VGGSGIGEGREQLHHVVHGAEALRRLPRQRAHHERAHLLGHARGHHRARRIGDHRGHETDEVRRVPRARAFEHLVCEHAPRELIGAAIGGLSARLLGRHVHGRPHGPARRERRQRCLCRRACGIDPAAAPRDPEIEHLDPPVPAHHHVFGLDVAVHDAGRVRRGERARHVAEPPDAPADRERRVADVRAQRLAGGQLHRDIRHAVRLADVVDRDRVRVIERRDRTRLAQYARLTPIGPVVVRREDLERDLAVELAVMGLVDHAHAAFTEDVLDGVAAHGFARLEHAPAMVAKARARREISQQDSTDPCRGLLGPSFFRILALRRACHGLS